MDPNRLAGLVCPATHQPLRVEGDRLVTAGGESYRILPSGQVAFIDSPASSGRTDPFDSVKAALKHRIGPGYVWLSIIFSPVLPRMHWPSRQTWSQHVVLELSQHKNLVVQIGSGTDRLAPDILNVDIFPYPEVDLIADGRCLPFADASVDGLISIAVLEHVEDPDAFLAEARRVLKPGGFILTGVPFMQGYHASPQDFYRWTRSGLMALHARHGFRHVSVVPLAGPTSSLVWILQEWLAIALSLGLDPLYYLWYFVLGLALCPLKLLDWLLLYLPQSHRINNFNMYQGTVP